MVELKQCNGCGVNLVIGENIAKSRFNSCNYKCKSCYYIKTRKWKSKNKEHAYNLDKKWRCKRQGVYGIFSDKTCLYVGESKQLDFRISFHKAQIKNTAPSLRPNIREMYIRIAEHSNVEIRVLEETPNHKAQEQVWIDYLNPLYNSNMY